MVIKLKEKNLKHGTHDQSVHSQTKSSRQQGCLGDNRLSNCFLDYDTTFSCYRNHRVTSRPNGGTDFLHRECCACAHMRVCKRGLTRPTLTSNSLQSLTRDLNS